MVSRHYRFKVFHIAIFTLTLAFCLLLKGLSSGDSTSLMQESVLSAATRAAGEEESAEVDARDQRGAPARALQCLFSLIRGEVEQLDSRALPLCLHQVLHQTLSASLPETLGPVFGMTRNPVLFLLIVSPSVTGEPRSKWPWISGCWEMCILLTIVQAIANFLYLVNKLCANKSQCCKCLVSTNKVSKRH